MTTRAEVVACARTWLGTPFHHQGRLKGVGVDCVGVPIKVGHELEFMTFDITAYPRQPNPALFLQYCHENLDEIRFDELQPADLVSCAFEHEQHLAIITEVEPAIKILHGYERVRKVVEHELSAFWRDKVRTCWKFKVEYT